MNTDGMPIRTSKGKLVGMVDKRTGFLHIKDGIKMTMIEIPQTGLKISFDSGNGVIEEVYIPPQPKAHKVA